MTTSASTRLAPTRPAEKRPATEVTSGTHVAAGVDVEVAGTRCPFCRDRAQALQAVVVCACCLSRHHEACWRESRACASCGRREALAPARPRPRAALGALALGLAFVSGLSCGAWGEWAPGAAPSSRVARGATASEPSLPAWYSDLTTWKLEHEGRPCVVARSSLDATEDGAWRQVGEDGRDQAAGGLIELEGFFFLDETGRVAATFDSAAGSSPTRRARIVALYRVGPR